LKTGTVAQYHCYRKAWSFSPCNPDQSFLSGANSPVNRYLNIIFLLGTKKTGQRRALY